MSVWKRWSPSLVRQNEHLGLPSLIRFVASGRWCGSAAQRAAAVQSWAECNPPSTEHFISILVDVHGAGTSREAELFSRCVQFLENGLQLALQHVPKGIASDDSRNGMDVMPLCDVVVLPEGFPCCGWVLDTFHDQFPDMMIASLEKQWRCWRSAMYEAAQQAIYKEMDEISNFQLRLACFSPYGPTAHHEIATLVSAHGPPSGAFAALWQPSLCKQGSDLNGVAAFERLSLGSGYGSHTQSMNTTTVWHLDACEELLRKLSTIATEGQTHQSTLTDALEAPVVIPVLCIGAYHTIARIFQELQRDSETKICRGSSSCVDDGDGVPARGNLDTAMIRALRLCENISCLVADTDSEAMKTPAAVAYAMSLSCVAHSVVEQLCRQLREQQLGLKAVSEVPRNYCAMNTQRHARPLHRLMEKMTRILDDLVRDGGCTTEAAPSCDLFDALADRFVGLVIAGSATTPLASVDSQRIATQRVLAVWKAVECVRELLAVFEAWDASVELFRRRNEVWQAPAADRKAVAMARGRNSYAGLCDIAAFDAVWRSINHRRPTESNGNVERLAGSGIRSTALRDWQPGPVASDAFDTSKECGDASMPTLPVELEEEEENQNGEWDGSDGEAIAFVDLTEDPDASMEGALLEDGTPNEVRDRDFACFHDEAAAVAPSAHATAHTFGHCSSDREWGVATIPLYAPLAALPLPWISGVDLDKGGRVRGIALAASTLNVLVSSPTFCDASTVPVGHPLRNQLESHKWLLERRSEVNRLANTSLWWNAKQFGMFKSRKLWSRSSECPVANRALSFVNSVLRARPLLHQRGHRYAVLRFLRAGTADGLVEEDAPSGVYSLCVALSCLRGFPTPAFFLFCGYDTTLREMWDVNRDGRPPRSFGALTQQPLLESDGGSTLPPASEARRGSPLVELRCCASTEQRHALRNGLRVSGHGSSSTDPHILRLPVTALGSVVTHVESTLEMSPSTQFVDVVVCLERHGLIVKNVVDTRHLLRHHT